MANKKGVSSKTHTQQQLNDYANQHNPNSKAYKANKANQKVTKSNGKSHKKYDIGILDGESYGWCDDWFYIFAYYNTVGRENTAII